MENKNEMGIVGKGDYEAKKNARKYFEDRLNRHLETSRSADIENFNQFEYSKSEEDMALIDFANNETNRLMRETGVEPYDIPYENYHIVSEELFQKITERFPGSGGDAVTVQTERGAIFDAQSLKDFVVLGITIFHETLHLKGKLVFDVGSDGYAALYRSGTSVNASQGHNKYHSHFNGLHEAIVSLQEIKSFPKMLDNSALAEAKNWLMSDEATAIKNKIALATGVSKRDIIWVGDDGESWRGIGYPHQREALDYVCEEIQRQFPEKYKSFEDVFKEFLKAHFTGHLITIGRLVEKTFGEGSFRILSNMETDGRSAVLHLESLKKARMRFLRNNKQGD